MNSAQTELMNKEPAISAPARGWKHSPWAMVAAGFAFRMLYIVLAHTYKFRTSDDNFNFGWEVGRIARSIALGHGFGSPFYGETGPTSWAPPIYPYFVAGVFKLFGIYTHSSALVILTINSLFAALTCWAIYRIAQRMFDQRVAVWSGWLWALLPNVGYWAVKFVWETSVSTFLLAALILLTLKMEGDNRLRTWAGFGSLWGVAALMNTSMCSFLPFSGLWLVYQLNKRGKRWFLPAALSAVCFFAVLSPWLVRNYLVFHKPIFIRGNFPVELRSGNNDLAEGLWVAAVHPSQSKVPFDQYRTLGEQAYFAKTNEAVRTWIKEHPKRFAELTLRRFVYFWSNTPKATKYPWQQPVEDLKNLLFLGTSLLGWGGLFLAMRRRVHGIFLFASLLVFYPAVYYITFAQPRYRHPIEPVILMLGVFLVSQTRSAQEDEVSALQGPTASNPTIQTLSIIIPVYNEKRTVMQLLNAVALQPIGGLRKEMVIVDDYSTDGTREFLQEMDLPALFGQDGIDVKLVLHERNRGKGAGVRTALEHCTGELILMQDADLEYDPADYPALIKPILDGHADAVFGNRFHDGSHRVPRFYRYVLNRLFSICCNALTGLALNDVTACYKVMRRDLFDRFTIKSDRFSFETELTVKLAKLKARIYEVPIVYHGRTYAEGKKINWTDGVAAFYHLVRFRVKD